MNDKKIRKRIEKIAKKISKDIMVRVENRVVYLEGRTNSWEDYLKLGILAGKIKDVKGVVNNIDYPGKKKMIRKQGGKEKVGEADVVIIGAGVVGCAIARELSKYEINVIIIEKAEDVACGVTKANNAMVHTGIGEKMGTLKQRLCVEGHKMYERLCEELNVPYEKCGMWIVLTKDSLKFKIPSFLANFIAKRIIPFIILRRGKKLGIPMKVVKRKELLKEEPNVTKDALVAVYSPTYGITSPYLLTIALAENAIENGAKIMLNTEVVDVMVKDSRIKGVVTTKGIIEAKYVINAAGLYADEIAEMAGAREYTIHPKKGATLIFDKEYGNYINHSMSLLRLPRTEHYKGGGVMLTVDGNIQWGPTISEVEDKEDTSVTADEIEEIFSMFSPLLPHFPRAVIAYFSGVRAATFTEDFFIEASEKVKGFIHVAGIQSPGLTAAPAIAKMVVNILEKEIPLEKKTNFNPYRKKPVVFRELSIEEKKKMIEKNPAYGKIVCRCEHVTEGEIIDAIHGKIPALNIDAIKRRTRAGMGRCHGSFCLPKVAKILSREAGIPLEKVLKDGEGSRLFIGKAKCLLEEK
ncbi:MAG: FAD/NAD(P)-binding oxidoreductase [Thermoplasmata archaeon]|nr:MAG: FAD/NAD(P)-binding oxidoreductase [Thermoplasmata archaeon]KAA0014830.1 MAG: FAD/NAD(P)-binding oxidoreductase [Thermoplasmata archaeon]OYT59066.1 MAG: FAD/NAD(P)-binding oxidoreductase [Thermoplasmatales archaeon ex4484_30]